MTGFLIGAVLLTACALLCILPALLRGDSGVSRRVRQDELNLEVLRDQARELDADRVAGAISASAHADARNDLARRLADELRPAIGTAGTAPSRALALAMVLVLPACAAALYFQVGNPVGVNATPPVAVVEAEGHDVDDAEIVAMVQRLAQRLVGAPDDAEGWYMLARSYSALGRFADAAQAYARVATLLPDDAAVLADYADALATAQGGSFAGKPAQLVARALAIAPDNVKALALAGSAAFARGDYAQAILHWQTVLPLVPADSDFARSTLTSIAQARASAGGPAAPAPHGVSGTVELAPRLLATVSPDDTVFIFARAADGPPMPLAALRKTVRDLPLRFTLDDSMAMVAGARLSRVPALIVGARISRSGRATPASGDLEGQAAPVKPGTQGIVVRIDSERQ